MTISPLLLEIGAMAPLSGRLSADYLELTRRRLSGVQQTLFPIGAKASVK